MAGPADRFQHRDMPQSCIQRERRCALLCAAFGDARRQTGLVRIGAPRAEGRRYGSSDVKLLRIVDRLREIDNSRDRDV